MGHCPTTVAGSRSGGTGWRMEVPIIGWPSNGKRSAAPQFRRQVLLAMGPASFVSLSLMNSGERLILRLLLAGCDVDWRFLLSLSAAIIATSKQRQRQTLPSVRQAWS